MIALALLAVAALIVGVLWLALRVLAGRIPEQLP